MFGPAPMMIARPDGGIFSRVGLEDGSYFAHRKVKEYGKHLSLIFFHKMICDHDSSFLLVPYDEVLFNAEIFNS